MIVGSLLGLTEAMYRLPANEERQIAEPDWSVELALQQRILGSKIGIVD